MARNLLAILATACATALSLAQCVSPSDCPPPADPTIKTVAGIGPALPPPDAVPPSMPPPVAEAPAVLPPVTDAPPQPKGDGDTDVWGLIESSDEYMLWWLKPGPLPLIATRNRGGLPFVGSPATRALIGPSNIDLGEQGGARFSTTLPIGSTHDYGMQFSYFFLGTRTTTLLASGTTDANGAYVARPYIDALTGREALELIAEPGVRAGELRAASSTRSQGIEWNLLANLARGTRWQIDGLAGYRFLMVNEGLHIGEQTLTFDAAGATYRVRSDQFDADNRFHGGQFGLISDIRLGPIFLAATGKLGIGQITEVVKAGGQTGVLAPGQPGVITPGGFYALPSNSGRIVREAFALLPEVQARLGVHLGDHGRLFVGYDFTYLSEAVRPGDQIDRVLNRTGDPLGPDRPTLAVRTSNLWLQGITIGVESRW